MVLCCRCNRTGQCRGCACVKAGNLCSNCLPSRLGSCSNVSPATNANTMTRHVPVHNEMSTTTPISSRTANPSTTSCSHTPAVAAASLAVSNSEVASTPETLIQQQPNSNSSSLCWRWSLVKRLNSFPTDLVDSLSRDSQPLHRHTLYTGQFYYTCNIAPFWYIFVFTGKVVAWNVELTI